MGNAKSERSLAGRLHAREHDAKAPDAHRARRRVEPMEYRDSATHSFILHCWAPASSQREAWQMVLRRQRAPDPVKGIAGDDAGLL